MVMLTEPTAVTAANYRLAAGSAFYPQRTGKVRAIVMHVTAGLQDLGMVGDDPSAEGTNRWALSTGARVSWHRIADSDGVERCLPSWATAWQAKGYNSNTVGLEISNVDARWDNKPAAWVKWTVWHAAVGVADWVVRYRVPIRRATQAELDRAIATNGGPVGFVDHSRLSTIRKDPGATFPWELFFTYVRAVIAGATHPDHLTPTTTSQEDDMPSIDEYANASADETLGARKVKDVNGVDRPVGWAIGAILRDGQRQSVQLAALTTAVEALAASKGADSAAIVAEVGEAVRERLARIVVTDEEAKA